MKLFCVYSAVAETEVATCLDYDDAWIARKGFINLSLNDPHNVRRPPLRRQRSCSIRWYPLARLHCQMHFFRRVPS